MTKDMGSTSEQKNIGDQQIASAEEVPTSAHERDTSRDQELDRGPVSASRDPGQMITDGQAGSSISPEFDIQHDAQSKTNRDKTTATANDDDERSTREHAASNPAQADDDIEPFLIFHDFDLTDSDMALLLEFSMISLMSEDENLAEVMADMLEAVHPHHAGAFIVRGLRAHALGDYTEAAEMFIVGTQARFKSAEAAALCLNLLNDIGMEDSETAIAVKEVMRDTEMGRLYLSKYQEVASSSRNDDERESNLDNAPSPTVKPVDHTGIVGTQSPETMR